MMSVFPTTLDKLQIVKQNKRKMIEYYCNSYGNINTNIYFKMSKIQPSNVYSIYCCSFLPQTSTFKCDNGSRIVNINTIII